ncbi:MAG: PAS domain-containing protein [Bacteroidales bacterium]|nr:PAS domain-containing protein [Bacteroidales bacterium]
MKPGKKNILFLEDTLDFKHLRSTFNEYDIQTTFVKNREEFMLLCTDNQYDILIISVLNAFHTLGDLTANLLDGINSNTPVITVVDNNKLPTIDQLINSDLNLITFPFSPGEILYRVLHVFKRYDTEKYYSDSISECKLLLDSTPVGLVQTDSHGKFLRFNSRFLEIIAINELDLKKENFFQLCHPDDYFLERKQLDRLLKKEVSRISFEIRLINNEGKTIVSSVNAGVIWNDDGHFNSFSFVVENIA